MKTKEDQASPLSLELVKCKATSTQEKCAIVVRER